LNRDRNPSACNSPKPCPGIFGDGLARHYDAFVFENGESNACINVAVQSDCDIFSAAYLNAYDPSNVCTNYLADMGDSNIFGSTNYSFNVSAGTRFVIIIIEIPPGTGCGYTLSVSGGSCRPKLNISQSAANKVELDWTTAA